MDIALNKLFDHKFKGLLEVDFRMLTKLLKETAGKFNERMRLRSIDDDAWYFEFINHHRLIESFNKKLQQLVTAGIIDFHFSHEYRNISMDHYAHLFKVEPQILTITDLEAGFAIWIVCCSLGPIAFLIEWMIRIKEYFVTKYVLEAFFKMKEVNNPRRLRAIT